ncbi:hypothetical protein [Streptosporangium sp. NPDC006007]|uniref:hypothetical protein n=1 Tax=Streptosporangium sp. NPDC006007 TaxID=3154575 RepID=UPI0033BB7AE1
MATTLRSLLPAAIGSLAVLGIALTLRTASATGELAPPPEIGACDGGALRRPAAPTEGAGTPDGMSPLLAALLRTLVQPPGCSPPPR